MSRPSITAAPPFAPSRTQRLEFFNADAEADAEWRRVAFPEMAALADYLDNLSAVYGTIDLSTSNVAFGTGSKTFAVSADKQFHAGQLVTATKSGDLTQYMFGRVTSYSGTTLTINAHYNFGSGSNANWLIQVVPPIFDIPILQYNESELRYLTGIR